MYLLEQLKSSVAWCDKQDEKLPLSLPRIRFILSSELLGIITGALTSSADTSTGAKYGFVATTTALSILTAARQCFLSYSRPKPLSTEIQNLDIKSFAKIHPEL